MRFGILADIHDAVTPLRAALARFREEGVEQVVSLGDAFETFKPGEAGPEVASLLREAGAVGVWGNHDVGLSHKIPDSVRDFSDPAMIEFTATLQPQVSIENCRFSHVEPWLNPTIIEELWHFDPVASSLDSAIRSFEAAPEQFLFIGHYHGWALTSTDGPIAWDGTEPLSFDSDKRYFVITADLLHGWSAVFDSARAELTPIRCNP